MPAHTYWLKPARAAPARLPFDLSAGRILATREPAESRPARCGLIKSPAIERGLIESDARVQRKSKAKGFLPGCALGPL